MEDEDIAPNTYWSVKLHLKGLQCEILNTNFFHKWPLGPRFKPKFFSNLPCKNVFTFAPFFNPESEHFLGCKT